VAFLRREHWILLGLRVNGRSDSVLAPKGLFLGFEARATATGTVTVVPRHVPQWPSCDAPRVTETGAFVVDTADIRRYARITGQPDVAPA
jgi:hypothetical protein